VIVSQVLTQSIVDSAQPYAKQLQKNGRLILIGLGEEVDLKFLIELSPFSISWADPNTDHILPNWKDFFGQQAYGCGLFDFYWM
jgi:hypothetical protein